MSWFRTVTINRFVKLEDEVDSLHRQVLIIVNENTRQIAANLNLINKSAETITGIAANALTTIEDVEALSADVLTMLERIENLETKNASDV